MGKLLPFLKPHRIAIIVALALMITELLVELLQPLVISRIIDDGILEQNFPVVLRYGAVMMALSFAAFASGIVNSFYASHVSQSFAYDVRDRLFDKIQRFSYSTFRKFPTSSLITRLTNDVTQLQNMVFMMLRIALRAPLLVIGGVVMALFVHFQLALLLVAAVPVLLVFLVWMMKQAGRLFRGMQEKLDSVNGVMQENLEGMRLIKAFVRGRHEVRRFGSANGELRDWTVYALRTVETVMPVLLLVMNVAVMAILWFGGVQVETGSASVGEVVAILNYSTRVSGALSVVSWIIMALSRANASAARVADVLDTADPYADNDSAMDEKPESSAADRPLEGTVSFRSVSFRYPDARETALSGISFDVSPGQTAAILGATGSGKSSLLQLIPRLYDASEGTVSVDGTDVRTMPPDALRKQIGYVPQEVLLFTGTVKENIAWGKEDASMEEIVEAAKRAQIHETIEKLPHGYETVLGQRGVNLSGGQKQRLSIARALVRRPRILLLDDSTSALDAQTEARLLSALKEFPCTTLMITQKIHTAMNADIILLIEDGRLLAEGNHRELLLRSSLYRRICRSQEEKGAVADVL